jgi:hypothetical protein
LYLKRRLRPRRLELERKAQASRAGRGASAEVPTTTIGKTIGETIELTNTTGDAHHIRHTDWRDTGADDHTWHKPTF